MPGYEAGQVHLHYEAGQVHLHYSAVLPFGLCCCEVDAW